MPTAPHTAALAGALPGASDTTALTLAARRLADLADQTRAHAGTLTAAAAGSGWRSTAATACRARLADLAAEVRGAAALLDRASLALDDHARTAAYRSDLLADATTGVLMAGALTTGVLAGGVLAGVGVPW